MNPLNPNTVNTPRRPSTQIHSSSSSCSGISQQSPLPQRSRFRPFSLVTAHTDPLGVEARYLSVPTSPSPRSSRHRISHSTPASCIIPPGPIRTIPPPPCPLPNNRTTRTTSPTSAQIASNRMSFLRVEQNYLEAKIDVKLENDGVVDMFGTTQTRASYSLPGHVILSYLALPTPGRLREITELKVVFEGKSEYWDDQGRYTPLRIWSQTLVLTLPSQPFLIPSHDPLRPSASTLELAIPFQVILPGHLPPTYNTEDGVTHNTSISYGYKVYSTSSWCVYQPLTKVKPNFSNQSLRLCHVEKSQSPYSEFTIRRHALPNAMYEHDSFVEKNYNIKPDLHSASPIECMVALPEWADIYGEERSLKLTLRVKARKEGIDLGLVKKRKSEVEGESSEEGVREEGREDEAEELCDDETLTHIKELAMEIHETEHFFSAPVLSYTSTHPLPAEQPSRHSSQHALISPRHPAADTLLEPPTTLLRGTKTRSRLRAEDGITRNFCFANDGLAMNTEYKRINIVLPMPHPGIVTTQRPMSSVDLPFVRIRQVVKITITCRNVGAEQSRVITLTAPIKFGTCPQTIPRGIDAPWKGTGEMLPAYTQLYHDNCVPKDHYRTLPAYTIPSPNALSSPKEEEDTSIPTTPAPRYSILFPSTTDQPTCATASSSRSPSPSPPARSVSPSESPRDLGSIAMKREISPPPAVVKQGWFARRRVAA